MDATKARGLAAAAAKSAGSALAGALHRGPKATGAVRQTLTIARPAGDVFAACRDVAVLARLVDTGSGPETSAVLVEFEAPRHYRWSVAGAPVGTELVVDPHGLSFTTSESVTVFSVLVHPAPAGLGSEVTFTLDLPVPDLPVPDLVKGGLAFTMLYRLRALLQTGEIPTLGDVPSTRTRTEAKN
ncbi:MAG: hypothetical protein ACRYF3_13430 [Janthinobacterium lividum]